MRSGRGLVLLVVIAALGVIGAGAVRAEEGMWTLDNLPTKVLKEKYGFEPDAKWLEHVRLTAVRFMDGGSGSIVSARGLVLTNHHVAMGQLQKMSSAEHDYVSTGFLARKPEEEMACPDLEVNILQSMQDVTADVMAAAKDAENPQDAIKQRDARKASLETEGNERTGLKCEVVSLYQGGEYWLYCYKRYTDVRLVMAPERQAAYFGGDSDNFTFPRHDLDMAFFRLWENGKPAETPHFLKWNTAGAKEADLVFIAGHPGRTERLLTYRRIEYRRDLLTPQNLEYCKWTIKDIQEYSLLGEEQARRGLDTLFGYSNWLKALIGMQKALDDTRLMEKIRKDELAFRARIEANPEWKKAYGDAWALIEKVEDDLEAEMRVRYWQDLAIWGSPSKLMTLALQLVLYARETPKPDADRLEGYHDSQLERLRFNLLSEAPLHADFEAAMIGSTLRLALEKLPVDDPVVSALKPLGDVTKAAREMCGSTVLAKVDERRKLLDGGLAAIDASKDPLIVLARALGTIAADNEG